MTYIPEQLRRLVEERAVNRCEYCRMHIEDSYPTHEVDHIYAEKHGGETSESNLCLSCYDCNRFKGSDLCSLDPLTGDIVALFHLRRDQWAAHFQLTDGEIQPISSNGRVTVKLLRLNEGHRINTRFRLTKLGRYP